MTNLTLPPNVRRTPLETIGALTAAINSGDLDAMLACFEQDALLVVRQLGEQSGETARGKDAIRKAYAGFVGMKPALRRVSQQALESGPIALHLSRWELVATAKDGTSIARTASSADVLHRQPDGSWLVVVYNPYGTAIVG